jgi:hypothetical protein
MYVLVWLQLVMSSQSDKDWWKSHCALALWSRGLGIPLKDSQTMMAVYGWSIAHHSGHLFD